jgi:carboxypeptidase C (cathepsin A)
MSIPAPSDIDVDGATVRILPRRDIRAATESGVGGGRRAVRRVAGHRSALAAPPLAARATATLGYHRASFRALPSANAMRLLLGCLTLASIAVIAGCGGGGGDSGSTPPPPSAFSDPVTYSSAPLASLPSANELAFTSKHTVAIDGTTYAYTATIGHLTAKEPATGAAEASFFYVAYTLDGASAASRPVTFFYNGGPGSATAWLHLGSFGPKRLVTGNPSTATPAPFPLVDNAQSLLDVSDLVFVDAVGAGWSEAIAPNTNNSFWGVDVDAAVFRDFVMRYVAANARESSPKYLFGESYGTTRSAVLAKALELAGVELTGVVLQSSILNYNSNCGVVLLANCAGFLPSYAATGAWYGLDKPNPAPADVPAYLASARTFATTAYAPAVALFMSNFTPASMDLVTSLANLTGYAAANWMGPNLNVHASDFVRKIIPGTIVGSYDTRVSAANGTPLASGGDPSSTFYEGGFASAITAYAASLGYTTPSTYVLLGNAINTWNFHHGAEPVPDVMPDLAAALMLNPDLRVLSLNGYHDVVTPFYLTELDLARLGANANVSTRFYFGGHMTYLDDASQAQEKADLKAFYAQGGSAP